MIFSQRNYSVRSRNQSFTMQSQSCPIISYSRSFLTWLGGPIFLIPLATPKYRPVLDVFMWELISFYDGFKDAGQLVVGPEHIEGLVKEFPVEELESKVQAKVSGYEGMRKVGRVLPWSPANCGQNLFPS